MRKDQLVKLLAASSRSKPKVAAKSKSASSKSTSRSSVAAARHGNKVAAAGRSSVARNGAKAARRSDATVRGAAKGAVAKSGSAQTARPLVKASADSANARAKSKSAAASREPARPRSPRVTKRIQAIKQELYRAKNLAFNGAGQRNGSVERDRLVVMVRDPYWLHAFWELTRQGVERAEAALGQEWHSARPVLRLLDVSSNGTTSTAETVLRHIDIHGGVNNWYIDVNDPPKSYRVDIGYLALSGKFYMLARSNVVTTPRAGSSDEIDHNWSDVAENFEKIYAMSGGYADDGPNPELQQLFEERLRRPMNTSMIGKFGRGVNGLLRKRRGQAFQFEVDAELIVFGTTEPDARVTLQGEPVQLRPDGTFTVRFSLPNCRQVLPAVASSSDGLEQRTVILAVERNTKVMEPLCRDSGE